MKKFLVIFCIVVFFTNNPAYSQDDDSVPYMPYPEQVQQEAPKSTPKTTKNSTKKSVKKKAPKKTQKKVAKKQAAPKISSLQRGIDLLNQGYYEKAKPYFLRAIQENRNDPNVWYWYGVWHERTGGFYQAQYFYSKAITIDPAFEPLSRVVYYPNDSEKTPLWDPKRPARVYPVETANNGVTTIPPNAQGRRSLPSAPSDPEIPKVPVYTPPSPGSTPSDGDSWMPGIYVPPAREEIQTEGEIQQIYTPPQPQSVVNVVNNEVVSEIEQRDKDRIIRIDLPLYTPPEPAPEQLKAAQTAKTVQPEKKQTVSTQTQTKQVKIPTSRVVKQSDKKTSAKAAAVKAQPAKTKQTQQKKPAQTKNNSKKIVSRDVKPSQPKKRSEPVRQAPPVQPQIIQEERQPQTQSPEYLPPVGQFVPDPGTVPNTNIPPVGQGSQR